MPLLSVRNLRARLRDAASEVLVLDGIDFSLEAGETFGIVGESGCGKSMTCLAMLGLAPAAIEVVSGEVLLDGRNLATLSAPERRKVLGGGIAMIFQDPVVYQNPVRRIGRGFEEILARHRGMSPREARREATRLLERVGLSRASERLNAYPHELSGGMNQRVMIARAVACQPRVLIADEPTTALDVTTQAQILDLLRELRDDTGLALILITHDLGVIAETVRRVIVMYCGRIVEQGEVERIFAAPAHPYTAGLLQSAPPLFPHDGQELTPIPGTVPPLSDLPAGCHFRTRCRHAVEECSTIRPAFMPLAGNAQGAACLRVHEWAANA